MYLQRLWKSLSAILEKLKLGGERKTLPTFPTSWASLTLSGKTSGQKRLWQCLNEYLQELTDIIFRWDGTLDKFVGDEIVVFWGAPVEQPNHTEFAIRCALHMSDKLNKMQ